MYFNSITVFQGRITTDRAKRGRKRRQMTLNWWEMLSERVYSEVVVPQVFGVDDAVRLAMIVVVMAVEENGRNGPLETARIRNAAQLASGQHPVQLTTSGNNRAKVRRDRRVLSKASEAVGKSECEYEYECEYGVGRRSKARSPGGGDSGDRKSVWGGVGVGVGVGVYFGFSYTYY